MKATDVSQQINGILLLNKSTGMTSNTALQKAKRLFGAKKAGHTGCLDPLATGMLPLCFGEATKVCQYLLDEDKAYQTTGLLGIKTNTSDSTGEIIARCETFSVSQQQLEAVLTQYTGQIKQIPSMFSALKHKGTPLYKLARKGIEIERKARDIVISQLQLDSFDGNQFDLTVSCSKGTYIRNLVEDIGDALAAGAHLTRLHRLYTSGFQGKPMYSLDDLESMSLSERMDCLIPMDTVVSHFEAIYLTNDEVLTIRQGRVVNSTNNTNLSACVRLYEENQGFIGLGERQSNGDIKAKRLLAF